MFVALDSTRKPYWESCECTFATYLKPHSMCNHSHQNVRRTREAKTTENGAYYKAFTVEINTFYYILKNISRIFFCKGQIHQAHGEKVLAIKITF